MCIIGVPNFKKSKYEKVILTRLKYICNLYEEKEKCEENSAIFRNEYLKKC